MTISRSGRVNRLSQVLSARERFQALLALYKRGEKLPLQLINEAPVSQADDLSRFISAGMGVNVGFNMHLDVTAERLRTLSALMLVANTRRRWGCQTWLTRVYLRDFSPEPILRADLPQRRREAGQELVPLEEVATWAETEDEEARFRELEEAVASGELKAQQDGDRVLIAHGDYCRWAKEEVPVYPRLGPGFDVRPASERKQVEHHLEQRSALIEALDASPQAWSWRVHQDFYAKVRVATGREELEEVQLTIGEEDGCLSEVIRQSVVSTYQSLRSMEQVIDEASETCLAEEDIAHPAIREELTRQLERLAELYAEAISLLPTPPFDLPEPGERELSSMRELMELYQLVQA